MENRAFALYLWNFDLRWSYYYVNTLKNCLICCWEMGLKPQLKVHLDAFNPIKLSSWAQWHSWLNPQYSSSLSHFKICISSNPQLTFQSQRLETRPRRSWQDRHWTKWDHFASELLWQAIRVIKAVILNWCKLNMCNSALSLNHCFIESRICKLFWQFIYLC